MSRRRLRLHLHPTRSAFLYKLRSDLSDSKNEFEALRIEIENDRKANIYIQMVTFILLSNA